jgi:predicted GIY-YIG superfamily endonuclease
MLMSSNASTDLYRYYDADGQLLYVGISLSAVARASQHRAEKGWWQDVARMTVEHLPTRQAAEDAERSAIRAEKPVHNVIHNGGGSTTSTKPVKATTFEGRVFAFGIPEGRCPVGLVTKVWQADPTHGRPTLEVELYSWLTGYFGCQTAFIDVQGGMQMLEAEYHIDGNDKVFDMDPLAAFQTQWNERHCHSGAS